MVHTLAQRLGQHPPFDQLSLETRRELAERLRVRYIDGGEWVFRVGESRQPLVFLVHKGAVRLEGADGTLYALCEAGDLFGVRAHLADRPYSASAVSEGECLLYFWPATTFLEWVQRLPELGRHLASGFAAEGAGARSRPSEAWSLPQQGHRPTPSRQVLTCGASESVHYAAKMMVSRRVGSILVVDNARRPVGIVTDVDMRRRVIAEGRDATVTSVAEIMSQPVVTVADVPTVLEATVAMAERGIHHLVTTEDGTPGTAITGIIANHDLLVSDGEHPAALVRAARRARTGADLAGLRSRLDEVLAKSSEAGLPIDFVATIAAAVTDHLTRRAIALAREAMAVELAPFAWLALGSLGRREQILRTDQDHALVHQNEADTKPLLEMARRVVDLLETIGFARCPAGMMASNPQWCLSVDGWHSTFGRWIEVSDPQNLMHGSIFFDFRAIAGDQVLEESLRQHIAVAVARHRLFLPLLAQNALANPAPLSFFKSFVLERSGEHRERFDIKARAMMPLADAARVLALDFRLSDVGTVARLQAVAQADAGLRDTCESAAAAYRTLMEVRTREGLRQADSGRFVAIAELRAYDRQRLRHAFSAIAEVQRALRLRYQIDRLP